MERKCVVIKIVGAFIKKFGLARVGVCSVGDIVASVLRGPPGPKERCSGLYTYLYECAKRRTLKTIDGGQK